MCIYMNIFVSIYTNKCIHKHTHTHTHTQTHTYVYIYIPGNFEERELSKYCTSVYVCVYVYVYIDAHRCIDMCLYVAIGKDPVEIWL